MEARSAHSMRRATILGEHMFCIVTHCCQLVLLIEPSLLALFSLIAVRIVNYLVALWADLATIYFWSIWAEILLLCCVLVVSAGLLLLLRVVAACYMLFRLYYIWIITLFTFVVYIVEKLLVVILHFFLLLLFLLTFIWIYYVQAIVFTEGFRPILLWIRVQNLVSFVWWVRVFRWGGWRTLAFIFFLRIIWTTVIIFISFTWRTWGFLKVWLTIWSFDLPIHWMIFVFITVLGLAWSQYSLLVPIVILHSERKVTMILKCRRFGFNFLPFIWILNLVIEPWWYLQIW